MTNIPHEKTLDSSVSLLKEGYPFLQNRMERFSTNIFSTRLLGEKAICIHGQEATQLLYDPEKFTRIGAIPKPIQKTLLGENGVQTLDSKEHLHRKALFMALMAPGKTNELMEQVERYWKAYLVRWQSMGEVVLHHEMQEILCLAACAWAGVPLKPTEVRKRAREFTAMVNGFGTIGIRHWRGRSARSSNEKWMRGIIKRIRKMELQPERGTAANAIAWHRGLNGKLLSRQIAAVELINVIRPIVAIATYIAYEALALHQYPENRRKLQDQGDAYAALFVQEVRRFYPFTPFVGGRVRSKFTWQGYQFKKGTLVLLDIYGNLHDPNQWENPERFNPERFRGKEITPFNFTPQGGGDFYHNHRCAGEWITIEVMKYAANLLTTCITYDVPEQELNVDITRIPTMPESGFIINNILKVADVEPRQNIKAKCPFHK